MKDFQSNPLCVCTKRAYPAFFTKCSLLFLFPHFQTLSRTRQLLDSLIRVSTGNRQDTHISAVDLCICLLTRVRLDVKRPLCNLVCVTSAWLRTFINAKTPSISSQSEATWTIQDELSELWLDCDMSRRRRKTMTFFLGKMTVRLVWRGIW